MRKNTTAAELARQRRSNIAYRAYVLKALRRFDLEGKSESTPQHRIRMSPFLAIDKRHMSDHVREILDQEQAYQAELVTALGEDAPDGSGQVNRPDSRGATRSSES